MLALRRPVLPEAEARAKGGQLLEACKARRAEDALRLIIEGADLDFSDGAGRTPLIAAGFECVASWLVEAGAKLDLFDKSDTSALMKACYVGDARARSGRHPRSRRSDGRRARGAQVTRQPVHPTHLRRGEVCARHSRPARRTARSEESGGREGKRERKRSSA